MKGKSEVFEKNRVWLSWDHVKIYT